MRPNFIFQNKSSSKVQVISLGEYNKKYKKTPNMSRELSVILNGTTRCQYHRFLLILIAVILLNPYTNLAQVQLPVGARAGAMAGAYVAHANSADALWLNPAGLVRIPDIELSFYYTKPYTLSDLHHGAFSLCLPFKLATAGIGVQSFGKIGYFNSSLALALARTDENVFYYSITVLFHTLQISRYGSTAWLDFNIGCLLKLNHKLYVGLSIHNISNTKLGFLRSEKPSVDIGLSYHLENQIQINLDIYKENPFKIAKRFGVEITPFSVLTLRTGLAGNPDKMSAGCGILFKKFCIDYAVVNCGALGITHQFSITFKTKQTVDR